MTAHDKVLAYIRTYIPYAVGAVIAWLLATAHLDLRGAPEVALTAFAVALTTNLYYVVIRVLEDRLPVLGVFLGFPRAPEYANVSNLWASLVRTWIPPLVGALVVAVTAWAALALGVEPLPSEQAASVAVVGVAVVEGLYYAAARALLARWPRLSWLLGGDFAPTYPAVRSSL